MIEKPRIPLEFLRYL